MSNQKLKGIFCIVIAVVALGFSIACFAWENDGHSPVKEFYGGDAYTGIQHAAVETAWNIRALISSVAVFAGFAFVIVCLAFLCKGILCLRQGEGFPCVDDSASSAAQNKKTLDEEDVYLYNRRRIVRVVAAAFLAFLLLLIILAAYSGSILFFISSVLITSVTVAFIVRKRLKK